MSRTELSLSDEWETPIKLFDWLCARYQFYPEVDVCATGKNKKCDEYFGMDNFHDWLKDGLMESWLEDKKNWCNPPHSQTELWVKKACREFVNRGIETMMIIPANSMGTSYAEACIENIAEYHPIFERPKFLMNGQEKDSARNSYFVVIWRRK